MQTAPQPPEHHHNTDELAIEQATSYQPQPGDAQATLWRYAEEEETRGTQGQQQAEEPEEEEEERTTLTTTAPTHEQEEASVFSSAAPTRRQRKLSYYPPPSRKQKRWRLLPLAIGIILLALATGAAAAIFLPMPLHASITITPRTATVTLAAQLIIGEKGGGSDLHTHQLAGRILPAMTLSEAHSVATTGAGREPAHPAHGTLTFYNSLTIPQTIPAGTIIPAGSGREVMTDEMALIPAGTLATNGVASVPAHTLSTGKSSHLAAYAIYGPCCRAYVQVENTTAFTGGTDARPYQAVSKNDITSATAILKTSLDQSMQAALLAQKSSGERLLPLSCQEQVSSDHKTGQEAKTVQVSLQETCEGILVKQADWNRLSRALLDEQARAWNEQARFVGDLVVHAGTPAISRTGQEAHVQVQLAATYAYHFPSSEVNQMKQSIAGKSVEAAQQLLAQFPGMDSQGVQIAVTGGRGDETKRLPTDQSQIEIHDAVFGGRE
jgi:hypothetical protein